MMGWQWHQLDHMQIICISLQTDNHASTSPLSPDALPAIQLKAVVTVLNTFLIIIIIIGKFPIVQGSQRIKLSVPKMLGARATFQCHTAS